MVHSYAEENNDEVKYIIYEIQITGGDWGLNDRITLSKSTYSVNKDSGKVIHSIEEIRTIKGKFNDESHELLIPEL